MSRPTRVLGIAALAASALLGGSAEAACVARDQVCARNVRLIETCVEVGDTCRPVVVEAPLCVGGPMWTTVFCYL